MPRWLPDSFDPDAHNARVRSLRSDMREADSAHRIVGTDGCWDGATPLPATVAGAAAPPPARRPSSATLAAAPAPDSPAAVMVIVPWPPTGNHAVRHAAGGHYLTREVVEYRREVARRCAMLPRMTGRYRLRVELSPPDRRRRDIDNALKSLFDALVPAGFLPDDSMAYMRELHVLVDDHRYGTVVATAETERDTV